MTYQLFAASWPHLTEAEGEFANMMNGYAKHVASTTLKLTEAKTLDSSIVAMTYHRVEKA